MQSADGHTLGWMPTGYLPTPLAIGTGEFSAMLLVLLAVAVPVAAVAFARSGRGLAELGRGRFAVDFEEESGDDRPEEELRQLVEARAWRRDTRGTAPGAFEDEIERLLGLDQGARRETPAEAGDVTEVQGVGEAAGVGEAETSAEIEAGLREEARQVVVAKNESRLRRGEPALDVEAEIDRLLENLT